MDGRDTPGHDGVRAAGRVNRKGALCYSALLTPVRQIAIVLNLPVVTTVKSAAVLLMPIDRPLWTERSDAEPGWIAATPS